MTKSKSPSVFDRLHALKSIIVDLRASVIKANASSNMDEVRASLVVGARAVNLFITTYSVSDHLADTTLTHLNSKMIRLSQTADYADTYNKLLHIMDRILFDIDEFSSRFKPEDHEAPLSEQVSSVDEDDIEDPED